MTDSCGGPAGWWSPGSSGGVPGVSARGVCQGVRVGVLPAPRAWTRGLLGSLLNLAGFLGGVGGVVLGGWLVLRLHADGVLPWGADEGSWWATLAELVVLANLPTFAAIGGAVAGAVAFLVGWPLAVLLDVASATRARLSGSGGPR